MDNLSPDKSPANFVAALELRLQALEDKPASPAVMARLMRLESDVAAISDAIVHLQNTLAIQADAIERASGLASQAALHSVPFGGGQPDREPPILRLAD